MNPDLILSNYQFDLPEELIAVRPAEGRHHSKLLVYDQRNDQVHHDSFVNLAKYLPENSQLVMNQSKVIPCRLLGEKTTGAKTEIFILGPFGNTNEQNCLIRTGSKKKVGDRYLIPQAEAEITALNEDGTFQVYFHHAFENLEQYLESNALVPIPPYIRDGVADEKDREDYQTVYAKEPGSVAAPTAGLHFTDEVFHSLESRGIDKSFVTLHVGPGTFAPVKSETITDHKMHSEQFKVDAENLSKLNSGKSLFAVGTTSLRVLESTWTPEGFNITPDQLFSTDIFLHPGKDVNSINGMITNFHLPGSSLLMLVSAIVGREKTLELYKIAIENKYRFYSYGDAMLILRKP
ncbi:MAG: tRNA preQ1(34) S-adenosylmethionine ribosyltransferase-isomerase QueA [Deltaproteobacteria bacterium]|nr:MAG: tRNA preQ1(34) S-adenosylmethionine ribosyltransferase-isomerase QueA [Deltaproteobacteria bacterium]TNF24698.1 MAG: tRNA preQ1(34) S-adenosylmethionine ribosyltransferase-isomerase QueA [Deltaproteobacteria bacterium]